MLKKADKNKTYRYGWEEKHGYKKVEYKDGKLYCHKEQKYYDFRDLEETKVLKNGKRFCVVKGGYLGDCLGDMLIEEKWLEDFNNKKNSIYETINKFKERTAVREDAKLTITDSYPEIDLVLDEQFMEVTIKICEYSTGDKVIDLSRMIAPYMKTLQLDFESGGKKKILGLSNFKDVNVEIRESTSQRYADEDDLKTIIEFDGEIKNIRTLAIDGQKKNGTLVIEDGNINCENVNIAFARYDGFIKAEAVSLGGTVINADIEADSFTMLGAISGKIKMPKAPKTENFAKWYQCGLDLYINKEKQTKKSIYMDLNADNIFWRMRADEKKMQYKTLAVKDENGGSATFIYDADNGYGRKDYTQQHYSQKK